ncbi:glycosyltransferase family 4 protein [Haloarcula amylovorans]|uniref:glycosyltransferase family 4 protein n=1 Tax=Haloarcula amylovorans TaxID=2562280 RepID=UPI0010769B73|nr:glycosyltransferase family 4 protein [Halomicroarcula amylolytica]
MRILALNYEFPPLGGGYGQYHLLCKKLAERGHEVRYVTSRLEGQPKQEQVDGIDVRRVLSFRRNRENATLFEMFSYIVSSATQLSRIVKDFDPDVCHTFFGIPTGALIFHPALRDVPSILTCLGSDVPHHNPDSYDRLYTVLTPVVKQIWDAHDVVVANSDGLREEIQQISPTQEVTVINNGINTEQFSPGDRTQGNSFRLLFVGRLIELKGVDRVLKLTKRLNEKSAHEFYLDIVGEGEEYESLVELARTEGIEQYVSFHGYVPHEEIDDVYRNADFYVQLSEAEGMSNTVMEAMASGTVPVISNVSGTDELIDSDVGRTIEGQIDETDVMYLLDLVADPERFESQKAKARERIVENFGSGQLARRYEECYTSIVTESQE